MANSLVEVEISVDDPDNPKVKYLRGEMPRDVFDDLAIKIFEKKNGETVKEYIRVLPVSLLIGAIIGKVGRQNFDETAFREGVEQMVLLYYFLENS